VNTRLLALIHTGFQDFLDQMLCGQFASKLNWLNDLPTFNTLSMNEQIALPAMLKHLWQASITETLLRPVTQAS
jgi:hypothetical protein